MTQDVFTPSDSTPSLGSVNTGITYVINPGSAIPTSISATTSYGFTNDIFYCKGDLNIDGKLVVTGSIKVGNVTVTSDSLRDYLYQRVEEEELRRIFPALESAWSQYQLILKMCASSVTDADREV